MKIERYITEYANAKRNAIRHTALMNPGISAELLRRIDNAVLYRERGIITADEAIKMIGGFCDADENMERFMTA